MRGIALTPLGIDLAVGALDEYLEQSDRTANRTIRNAWVHRFRLQAAVWPTVIGLVVKGKTKPYWLAVGAAATPLAVKSVAALYRAYQAGLLARGAPTVIFPNVVTARNWQPTNVAGGGYRPTT